LFIRTSDFGINEILYKIFIRVVRSSSE